MCLLCRFQRLLPRPFLAPGVVFLILSGLLPRMVEALICAQDWLRKSHGTLIIEENFLELEDLKDSKFLILSIFLLMYLFIFIMVFVALT